MYFEVSFQLIVRSWHYFAGSVLYFVYNTHCFKVSFNIFNVGAPDVVEIKINSDTDQSIETVRNILCE